MKDYQDAFGHEIYDYFEGKGSFEIIERDDGYFDLSRGAKVYLSEYEDWPPHEKEAMHYVCGRVLDVGCGAGRHLLYRQQNGFDVMGVDNSPLAIEVCRRRGIHAELCSITQISPRLGTFDTILMLGNNFGLFGSPERAKRLLERFHRITSPNGRIIAESNDPYKTEVREHKEYQEFNRK